MKGKKGRGEANLGGTGKTEGSILQKKGARSTSLLTRDKKKEGKEEVFLILRE